MPPKTGDAHWAHLEDLSTEYRIKFLGEIEPSQWPDSHRTILQNAKQLGGKTYDSYATLPGVEESEPWKVKIKYQAKLLVDTAGRCRQRNESSWRYACEPIIMGRLSSEVCCRTCRKRLWRSEIEVTREGESTTAERLRFRQQVREPCRCPRMARSQDHLEAIGLNPIFSYRVDERVHHGDDITKRLGKGEEPDRMYGLRQTRNIENLLHDGVKRQFQDSRAVEKQVQEVLGLHQPLTQTGDRLLFPYLVLEAKSASSSYSWHRIQLQTAFSIYTFLKTQDLLRTATGRHSKWQSGPLVWFFANRGEDWRLYAAYMEPACATTHTIGVFEYLVVNIWSGSITTRNGALQLLLLVDYVFDWARDIYREDIIKELRTLATGNNDAATVLHTDTDIFSTHPVDTFDQSGEPSGEGDDFRAYMSIQESFSASDTPGGVVRHASLIKSEFCCIFITRDNVQTMLQSMQQAKLKIFCGKTLGHMKDASLVSLSALNAIERQWTGSSRLSSHQLAETKFYTIMSVTTYISSTWHLIRELFVFAIAQDAWTDFAVASKLKLNRGKTREPLLFEEVDEETLLNTIKRLQAGSPLQVLHAAIVRRSVKIALEMDDCLSVQRDDDGDFRRIVHFVYMAFKKGTLEPQEPFIRFSRRLDQQHLFDCDVEPFFHETPHVSKDGCVLLTATLHPVEQHHSESKVCAYLTTDTPSLPPRKRLSAIVANAFATCDVYHTTRSHWVSILAPLAKPHCSEKNPWNLQDTYGVYSNGFKFLAFILALGSKPPITQGSSRNSDECGSLLYERNFVPWADPRRISRDVKSRMFILYKLFSREIQFWRATAIDRKAQGVPCCECCAKIGEDDICYDCESVLEDPYRYLWFKNCLLGKQPFEKTALEGFELKEMLRRSQSYDLSLYEDGWDRRLDGSTDDDNDEEDDDNEDDDWACNLGFYPKLEKPFRDIARLWVRWKEYEEHCKRFSSRKRQREEDSSFQSRDE